MKKISKLFIACIISILLLVFSAVPAFAETDASKQEALDAYLQDVVPELTNVSDEEVTASIQYYIESGYQEIADGFQSWIDLKGSVGAFKSVGTCTYVENEDGTLTLHAPVTCENGTLDLEIMLDRDGYVATFLFTNGSAENTSGIGSKLKEASVNLVVGMGTVFAVLIFLCWVISLFKNISKIEKKLADKKAAKSKAKTTDAPETKPAEVVSVTPAPSNNDELQAVIAAAIAAYEADNGNSIEKQPALGNGINIKTYRRN